MDWALLKAVSLAYLLCAVQLSLASLAWSALRPRLAPPVRASAGYGAISAAALFSLALGIIITVGVYLRAIRMTTHLFHGLMYGWLEQAITISGICILMLSLLLLAVSIWRGRLPRFSIQPQQYMGMALRRSDRVATAGLVGVFHPELWVNPAYWDALSSREQELVLAHERQHLARRDNAHKLTLQFIAALFYALPWVRRLPEWYELDSEFAVDAYCREHLPEPEYQALIGAAAAAMLGRSVQPILSAISQSDLALRLRVLHAPPAASTRPWQAWGALSVVALSCMPGLLLLAHPVTRCFCACYLGF